MIDTQKIKQVFKQYVSNYDLNNGKILLKYNHILRVAEISKRIAQSLNLSDEDVNLAEAIGIFHDIGRFEQIRVFDTFVDVDSINHGEYGAKILFEDGLIKKFEVDEEYYDLIKTAVVNHNRSFIEDGLSERALLHCKIIRDSDKLDIFNVALIDETINTYGIDSMENETFTDEIVREFKEDHYIDYKKRKTYGDRWISHICYVYDFNFKSSYQVMKEKDYINKVLKKVNFKRDDTVRIAKELVNVANQYIEDNC